MVAGDGKIVNKHMRDPCLSAIFPLAPGYLINAPPDQSNFQIVFVFTGHLAGLTARAGARVEVKSQLLCHFL
jgi:hypothetical protein